MLDRVWLKSAMDANVALTLSDHAAILAEAVGASPEEAKWIHIATEGQFLGYLGGQRPFQFTRQTFDDIVKNIRASENFKAGPNGEGIQDVVPWDFNHASEQDPTQGALPFMGAPAQGWAMDAKVVDGSDGKAQLHTLTRFLEPALGYVKAGSYKWASVAVAFNHIHPVSGQNVGARLTSIALTNTPFIEGLQQLVASMRQAAGSGSPEVALRFNFFDTAEGPTEANTSLKELFGIPETSTVADVMTEVAKLAQWIETNTVPLGVDADSLIGSMRKILGLPALTTASEVLDNATQIIQRLLEEAAGQPGQPQPSPPPIAASGGTTMDDKILKILASKLGVRESDDVVLSTIGDILATLKGLAEILNVDSEGNGRALLEAAKEKTTGMEKLAALLKALDVKNPEKAQEKVAKLLEQADELVKALPELKDLRKTTEDQEGESSEADVEEVATSYQLPDGSKAGLLLQRKDVGHKLFLEAWPKDKAPEAKPTTATPAATPSIAQTLLASLTVSPTGQEIVPKAGAAATPAAGVTLAADSVDLANIPGRNRTEKCMNILASKMPTWEQMSHEQRTTAAWTLSRSPNIIDSSIAL